MTTSVARQDWHDKVVGVVLAGGLSSRMGSDKSELVLAGESLLNRSLSKLKSLPLLKTMVSSGQKSHGIQDKLKQAGPLGAIHTILTHQSIKGYKGALFYAVDMPFVEQQVLHDIVSYGYANHVACYASDYPLPCYIPNHPDYIQRVERLVNSENRSLKRYLSEISAQPLNLIIPDDQLFNFTNINTPQQWAQTQSLNDASRNYHVDKN